ncbi:MAG TPA: TylF/MycF/NovP-related O-methyltransferase [Acetobacteraceae bacterium]|nr:TylF/MycF/NovP-related O-methyltransferase [Acetobacteraceae bacterium]
MLKFDTGQTTLEYLDISDEFFAGLIERIRQHTRTLKSGVESAWSLYQSIEYIVRAGVPGDIVECGVWSGGSMLLAAHALIHFGDTSRRIFLYDTFAGMPRPDLLDARWDGVPALPTWEHYQRNGRRWCYGGGPNHVRQVVSSSGYPEDKLVFVEGKVEDTLPTTRPETISLLRLDTDFFRSTYHELLHLYPLLSAGGILIVDDYGAFQGARIATDLYIAEHRLPLFLSRIDASVRLAVKPPPLPGCPARPGSP